MYDGPGGTGNLLASKVFPPAVITAFVSLSFGGTAKSVVLSNIPYFDDVVFGLAGPTCPAAEIWDPTTNAIVGPLENEGMYCLVSYNLRAALCDETATLVDMRLTNTATGVQIRRQKETIAPYVLWGDDAAKGDVFPNQKKLRNGPYRFRVTVNGVDTDYAFTQSCPPS